MFSADLPGDLVFDPIQPSFKHILEHIKTNILSKIHDYCFKNVTTRVLTRFLLVWPGDLVFDLLDLEIIKTNILSNIYDNYFKNVTSGVLTVFC